MKYAWACWAVLLCFYAWTYCASILLWLGMLGFSHHLYAKRPSTARTSSMPGILYCYFCMGDLHCCTLACFFRGMCHYDNNPRAYSDIAHWCAIFLCFLGGEIHRFHLIGQLTTSETYAIEIVHWSIEEKYASTCCCKCFLTKKASLLDRAVACYCSWNMPRGLLSDARKSSALSEQLLAVEWHAEMENDQLCTLCMCDAHCACIRC